MRGGSRKEAPRAEGEVAGVEADVDQAGLLAAAGAVEPPGHIESVARHGVEGAVVTAAVGDAVVVGEHRGGDAEGDVEVVGVAMVVVDQDECFTNAVNTAQAMNTVAAHIINKHFKRGEN